MGFKGVSLTDCMAKEWITIKISTLEMACLERFCQVNSRTKSDVVRELIRSLPTYSKNWE